MTLLTAYNDEVQRIFRSGYLSRPKKREILSEIEERVFEMGKSFRKLFPNKKARVLDEIIYLLSGTGICPVGADTLAKKAGCGVRTVYEAVASIKETDQILVARLANGNAGKYIFVYKQHPNFNQIMKEVFFIDSLPEKEENAGLNAEPFAGLENAENVEAVSVEGQKTSSNYINYFKSIQEKDIIQNAIENDVQDSRENQAETRQKLQQYHANEFQLMLFDEIMAFPYPESIKSVAGTIALRVGIECDAKKVTQARTLLKNMALNMANNVQIPHVVAVFTEGMSSKRYLSKKAPETALKQYQRTSKVKFYNWLEDRN